MVPATDSAKRLPQGRAWTLLVLLALLAFEPGCARLKSFRKADDQPSFGTDRVSNAKKGKDQASADDIYAERLAHSQEAVKPTRAAVARSSNQPRIALQPPVTVMAADVETETKTASLSRIEEAPAAKAPPTTPTPAPTLDAILAKSRERLESLTSYRVDMNHQERVGATLKPAEDIVLNIRRSPRAIRLEWPTGLNKGREVLYNADPDGGKGVMHVQIANSPLPRMSMAPDSPLATMNSRHPITEAGFDTIIDNMANALEKQRSGDSSLGKIRYVGMERPEGFDKRCHKIVRVTPTNETWVVYIDPAADLLVLVQATAANGDLLERYAFRDPKLNPNDLADAGAFDPDSRWGPAKGLFQRLARGGTDAKAETETR